MSKPQRELPNAQAASEYFEKHDHDIRPQTAEAGKPGQLKGPKIPAPSPRKARRKAAKQARKQSRRK